jgi:hypothetical protein
LAGGGIDEGVSGYVSIYVERGYEPGDSGWLFGLGFALLPGIVFGVPMPLGSFTRALELDPPQAISAAVASALVKIPIRLT